MSARIVIPPTITPAAFAQRADGPVERLIGRSMGTGWSVRYVPAGGLSSAHLQQGVELILSAIVDQMSTWEAQSGISRFNRSSPGEWQALKPEFLDVLDAALRIADRSGGAFDPTVGDLVDLWGFGPSGGHAGLPDPGAVDALRTEAGWRQIELDKAAARARRLAPSASLDFSGIAKGYAVDRIADWLAGQGILNFLVEIGGELRGGGLKPDGQPWWVDAEIPPGCAVQPLRFALHQVAVATSGDYRRAMERQGKRWSHTLDPRTGRPLDNGVASVTVLHSSAMLADAWATAIGVLGQDEGLDLARREKIAAQIIRRGPEGAEESLSPALRAML